ncbi:MAG: DNA methylase [Clostridiales bacterium]|nr:DNA methylase [Clostridiales bacterium]
MNRTFLAIDLKSFYASAECADRQLDPLTTNLVVADASRTEKTICLAVSPSLKAYGISGRARLFEVVQKVKEINQLRLGEAIRQGAAVKDAAGNDDFSGSSFDAAALAADPSLELSYITAPPRMARYVELSGQIYAIYLKYIAPEDIHPYSIDEVFMDITSYLDTYHMTAHELAMTMIREVLYTTGITATAGIGTNLYLSKIAMDIVAKHAIADSDGVRIAELNELSYREFLWNHKPLTDFWRIGAGTARRLEGHYLYTMGDVARASIHDQEWFYKTFGIDAEILIDHAWGIEPCTIAEIKNYEPETNSICEGQVLSSPYTWEKSRIIVEVMTDSLVLQLVEKRLTTDSLTLHIGYDRVNVDNGSYQGSIHMDHYGRVVPKPAHGSTLLSNPTNLGSELIAAVVALYDRIIDRSLFIRRIALTANRVIPDAGYVQLDLFTDVKKQEKEKKLQEAVLSVKKRYGKNALLRGMNFEEGATMRDRNGQIGGHKA